MAWLATRSHSRFGPPAGLEAAPGQRPVAAECDEHHRLMIGSRLTRDPLGKLGSPAPVAVGRRRGVQHRNRSQDLLVPPANRCRQSFQPPTPERRNTATHTEYSIVEPDHDAIMDQPFEGTDQVGPLSEWIRGVGADAHLQRQIQWANGDRAVGTLEVS